MNGNRPTATVINGDYLFEMEGTPRTTRCANRPRQRIIAHFKRSQINEQKADSNPVFLSPYCKKKKRKKKTSSHINIYPTYTFHIWSSKGDRIVCDQDPKRWSRGEKLNRNPSWRGVCSARS